MRPFAALSRVCLLVAWLGLLQAGTPNQWRFLGPEGGVASSIALKPDNTSTILLGSGNGVFRSQDGGETWAPSSTGLTCPLVEALTFDPQQASRVYAGTDGGGVFRSLDSGQTWQPINLGLEELHVTVLALHPSNPSRLFAGTLSGVFRSDDGGDTWVDSSAGLVLDLAIENLAIAPSDSQTLYLVVPNFGVFRSGDGGQSWDRASEGLTSANLTGALAIDPTDPNTAYVGTTFSVFQTVDGMSWVNLLVGGRVTFLFFDPADSSRIYAVGDGLTFEILPEADPPDEGISPLFGAVGGLRQVAFHPADSQIIVASSGRGTFRTGNRGEKWAAAEKGLRIAAGRSLQSEPANSLRLYFGGDRAEMLSTDGGFSWTSAASRDGISRSIVIDPLNPGKIFSAVGDRIARSEDSGRSWRSPQFFGIGGEFIIRSLAIDPTETNNVFAVLGGADLISHTLDGGIRWSLIAGFPIGQTISQMAVDPLDGNILYAASAQGLLRSANRGFDWAPVSGLDAGRVDAVTIDPTDPNRVFAGGGDGVFKSANRGLSFSPLPTPSELKGVRSIAIDPTNSQIIWAAAWGVGIFVSADGGQSWQPADEGLDSPFVSQLTLDPAFPRKIYAASRAGVLVREIDPAIASPFLEAPMEVSGNAFPDGGHLLYTVTLHNQGGGGQTAAPAAEFVVGVPPRLQVLEALADRGQFLLGPTDQTAVWRGTLPPGQETELMLRTRVVSVGGEMVSVQGRLRLDSNGDGAFDRSVLSSAVSANEPHSPARTTIEPSPVTTQILVVPHVSPTEDSFVGLAVANLVGLPQQLEFLALAAGGEVVDSRVSDPVNPFGQSAFLSSQAFADPVQTLGVRTNAFLEAFFMIGDNSQTRLDGIGDALPDSQLLYFSKVHNTGPRAAHLYLFNADIEPSHALVRLAAPSGEEIEQTEVMLSSFGSMTASMVDLFGDSLFEDGFLRVEADRPLRGFVLLSTPDTFEALPGQPPSLARRFWSPHFFWNDLEGDTSLRFFNAGAQTAEAEIFLRNGAGVPLGDFRVILPPQEIRAFDLRTLAREDDSSSLQGSVEVLIDAGAVGDFPAQPQILASITYDGGVLKTRSTLPLADREEEGGVHFLQLANSNKLSFFQGVAVVNPDPVGFAFVRIRAVDSQGNITAERFFGLPAHFRFVGLLNDPRLFGEGFDQVGGYLELEATVGSMVAFALFGGQKTLSAIQARPSSGFVIR